MHKDKGQITNLLCIYRPLSLYGLTANMKGYEPTDVKPFQKIQNAQPYNPETATQLVPLILSDYNTNSNDKNLWERIAEQEELDYLIRSSQRVLKPTNAQQTTQSTNSAATSALNNLMQKSQ